MRKSHKIAAAALTVLVAPATSAALVPMQQVELKEVIANLEYESAPLTQERLRFLHAAPAVGGDVRYGSIPRRVVGEDLASHDHFVPFMVRYSDGFAIEAWYDANLNGDLTDDASVSMSAYPGLEGGRSFLATLRWTAIADGQEVSVKRIIRVVLEPLTYGEGPELYRLQQVHAMVGTVQVGGVPHRAVLYDGNADGIYTKEFGDGLFVDLNDDLHFEMDRIRRDFGSFRVPFQMADRILRVASILPDGSRLALEEVAQAPPMPVATVGKPAPPFSFLDLEGREVSLEDHRGSVVLVYFWTSWCGVCGHQAEPLRALYQGYHVAGTEILAISYDTDRRAMEEFRVANRQTWPSSFTGYGFWENPIGRLYGADGSGAIYLVNGEGNLDGIYADVAIVEERLRSLLSTTSGTP